MGGSFLEPPFFVVFLLCREKLLSLHVKTFYIMKNRVFVFVMLAAAVAGLVSCNCGHKQPQQYALTVEALVGAETQSQLNVEVPMAVWDDGMTVTTASLKKGEVGYWLVPDDSAAVKGVLRVVYPADAALAGPDCLEIDTLQQSLPLGEGMVYYGETTEETPDAVVLKAVSGVVCMSLTTTEQIAKVRFSTADSNKFMAGTFSVSNYPFPVLTATDMSTHGVEVVGLEETDFTQGATIYCYMAPGCYSTFKVEMITPDGRICTKNLKEGKEVVLDRNRMVTLNFAAVEEPLVFE